MTDETLDNDTLWKLYSPKPNPWFTSEITYEGWGIATFEKPAGTIEGPTKILVDETGDLNAEMEYREPHTDITVYGRDNFKFIKFVQGNIGSKETENMVGWGTGNSNPCSKLTIKTDVGVFKSEGNVLCLVSPNFDNKCKFRISEGTFRIKKPGKSKYWVAPLINFISDFHLYYDPILTQHPLRLFTTPLVPDIPDKKQKEAAIFFANRANTLIAFYFGKKIGYIQPALDYNEKNEKLKSGEIEQGITSLMISEITRNVKHGLFAHHSARLLSMATGVEVSIPWIELRDKEGKLISRKHIIYSRAAYEKGYAIIDEVLHGGIGHLLSVASCSSELDKEYISLLINYLIKLNKYEHLITELTAADKMALLSRVFDALCKAEGIESYSLSPRLSDKTLSQVKVILDDAADKLKQLSNDFKQQKYLDEGVVLQRISDKVRNVPQNKDGDFGLRVMDLLKRFNFPDAKIMEKYFSESHFENRMTWTQALSKYRNDVIHNGSFQLNDGALDFWEILSTENHLHDILVRITLNRLGYKGQYQPRMARHLLNGKTVNWVTEQTTAIELGYGEEE